MRKKLLNSKVEVISTNTLDNKIRIKIAGMWFVEDEDPIHLFGTPQMHDIKL